MECASAIERLHRDGHLNATAARDAMALLDTLRKSWFEVQPGDAVREQALRLLRGIHCAPPMPCSLLQHSNGQALLPREGS